MEKEHLTLENGFFQRSDKIWEDGRGNFAAVMLTMSGRTEEYKFFNYRPQMTALEPTQVRWDLNHDVVVLPHANITALIRRGYARFATTEEMDAVEIHVEAEEIVEPDGDAELTDDLKVRSQPDPASNGRAATKARGTPTKTRGGATKTRGGSKKTDAATRKPKAEDKS